MPSVKKFGNLDWAFPEPLWSPYIGAPHLCLSFNLRLNAPLAGHPEVEEEVYEEGSATGASQPGSCRAEDLRVITPEIISIVRGFKELSGRGAYAHYKRDHPRMVRIVVAVPCNYDVDRPTRLLEYLARRTTRWVATSRRTS